MPFISGASQVIVALIIVPFMLFYLLRDGKGLRNYLTQFMPTKLKEPVGQVFIRCKSTVVQLVRGQVTVAIIVAVMFIIFSRLSVYAMRLRWVLLLVF